MYNMLDRDVNTFTLFNISGFWICHGLWLCLGSNMPGFKIYFEFFTFFNFFFSIWIFLLEQKLTIGTCNYEQVFISWNFVLPIYKCFPFCLTCKPYRKFYQVFMLECVIHNPIIDILKSGWKKWIANAASRCTWYRLKGMSVQKNSPQKFLVTLFPYIFPVKTKWNIACQYSKTKRFSRNTIIFTQMHWKSNIFGTSVTTIGVFGISPNRPILNLKKTVCPKKVWIRHR